MNTVEPIPLMRFACWGKNRAEADDHIREWATLRNIKEAANIRYEDVSDGIRAEVYVYDG